VKLCRLLGRHRIVQWIIMVFVAGIWACASGGGISGTSIVAGPISEFGSIFVNGIEFDTTDAVVTIEGDPAVVGDLRRGMYVFVRGKVNRSAGTGVAERVASDHVLEGPVDAVNSVDGTFVAFSQLVITDASTVFEGATIDTLVAGDLVEVFGVRDADDAIRATRVERKDEVEEFEVTGTVSALDEDAMTFQFGILTVDYSGAEIDDPEGIGLANDRIVEAETEDAPQNDLLVAISLDIHSAEFEFEEGDGAEIRGVVTQIVSPSEFVLNGIQRVITNARTRYENGEVDDIVLNAVVDVEGELDDGGTLIAEEVEFQ
jgi:hypothetical protein